MTDPQSKRETWDFLVTQERTDAYGRSFTARPLRQHRRRTVHEAVLIKWMRQEWADLVNDALTAEGCEARYDAGSYEEMGAGRSPFRYVEMRDYKMECRGHPTEQGVERAVQEWDAYLEDRLTRQDELREAEMRAVDRMVNAALRGVTDAHALAPGLPDAIKTANLQLVTLVEERREAAAERVAAAVTLRRVASRPRLIATA